ncbi:MAG: Fis family transcriptional regulator [Halanaerobium sp.]|nr:MAG: Fis family transcriptional regulator [Halanaerobium sp.]
MPRKMEIEYPDTLLDLLQETPEEFEREAKMAMAVKLFELKRISSGMAAEMVGKDRASFLLELQRYGVEMINMESDELESDVENA